MGNGEPLQTKTVTVIAFMSSSQHKITLPYASKVYIVCALQKLDGSSKSSGYILLKVCVKSFLTIDSKHIINVTDVLVKHITKTACELVY